MKKIISAILAAALLFSLCSCARAESVTLERGTVENGVYENGSMGIKINLGEGWTFYSDDEIEENVRPSDFMPGDDTQELEAGDVFCDMYCSNEAATNINISYEYVGTAISVAKYLSALEASVKEQFMELEGFTVTETENTTVDTATGKLPCLKIVFSYDDYGIMVYETIAAYSKGGYIAGITVAAASESEVSDLFANASFE